MTIDRYVLCHERCYPSESFNGLDPFFATDASVILPRSTTHDPTTKRRRADLLIRGKQTANVHSNLARGRFASSPSCHVAPRGGCSSSAGTCRSSECPFPFTRFLRPTRLSRPPPGTASGSVQPFLHNSPRAGPSGGFLGARNPSPSRHKHVPVPPIHVV